MKINISNSVISGFLFAATMASVAEVSFADSERMTREYAKFNANGNLLRPENYREWVFAGTGTTPKSLHKDVLFPDFQNVYIDPASYQVWKNTGKFPDGTIIVKELIHIGETNSPVGQGFWQGNFRSLSATVKSKDQFPGTYKNWNYFNWTNKEKGILNQVAAPLGEQCAQCHIINAPEGTVFYNFFAVLRDAKGAGSSPENSNTRKGLKPRK